MKNMRNSKERGKMKGVGHLALIIGLVFVLIALSGTNLIRSAADTFTADETPQSPEELVPGMVDGLKKPVMLPLWLLLMIMTIILLVK